MAAAGEAIQISVSQKFHLCHSVLAQLIYTVLF